MVTRLFSAARRFRSIVQFFRGSFPSLRDPVAAFLSSSSFFGGRERFPAVSGRAPRAGSFERESPPPAAR